MARAKNARLKSPNTEEEYTHEQVMELKRCATDPVYFIEKYVKIQHPVKGAIPFALYDYQKKMVRSYQENRFTVVLASRQVGKSATSSAYLLWYAMFNFDRTVLIAANKNSNAMEMILRIRFAYEELPFWLKPGVKDDGWNKHEIGFDNGSRIISTATSEDSGRGMSISLLFLDEFSFVKPNIQDEFWTAMAPTLSCVTGNTRVLTTSGFCKIGEFHTNKKIGDYFEIRDLVVWGKSGLEKVSHGYVSPDNDTLIVKTRHGFEVEVTPIHPLYALLQDYPEMVPAQHLRIGDALRIDVGMGVYGNNSIPPDMAYMLGGYIAEGWMAKNHNGYHTIYISNNDVEFRDVFINNPVKMFVNNNPRVDFDVKMRCHSKQLISQFIEYGIDPMQKCYDKLIPEDIFKSDKITQSNFLSGLFDGDGSVTDRSINLTSTSKQLILDVQLLLVNMGIISTIIEIKPEKILAREKKTQRILPHGKPLQSLRTAWSLNVPLSQYVKFGEVIGFRIFRKQKRLRFIASQRKQDDWQHFRIPVDKISTELNKILTATGKSKKWFRDKGLRLDKCLDGKSCRTVNQQWLNKLRNILSDNNISSPRAKLFFDEFLTMPSFWDDIVKITPSQNITYDFTVPKTHSFLQNGIMGSNTGGSCIIASTPNGDQNIFAQTWRGANAGTNGFYPVHVRWDEPPGRDDNFKQQEIGKIGLRKWNQEYECIFLSSDSLLIDSLFLTNLTPEIEKTEPIHTVNDVIMFDAIRPNQTYLLGVDPATGSGEDFSVITIYSFPALIQVGEYRSNTMSTKELYETMKNMLKHIEMKGASVYFSIENNGVGQGLIALYEADENSLSTPEFISESGKDKLGFTTTARSKMRACVNLKQMLEGQLLFIKSKMLLSELKSYIRSKGAYAAQLGSTDDCVAATLVVLRLVEEISTYEQEAFDKLYSGKINEWGEEEWDGYEEEYDDDDEGLPMCL